MKGLSVCDLSPALQSRIFEEELRFSGVPAGSYNYRREEKDDLISLWHHWQKPETHAAVYQVKTMTYKQAGWIYLG